MAQSSPPSPVPWIALFIGVAFALMATLGALSMMAAQTEKPQTRMTWVPPQIDAPRLPDPFVPLPS